MKTRNKWNKIEIILWAVLCYSLVFSNSAMAIEKGTYTAPTTASYYNPDTGEIDDGGTKNAEIGEGMVKSVLGNKAFIETDGATTHVTVRINMISNITKVSFTARDSNGSYYNVSAKKVSSNSSKDTSDYRLVLRDPGAWIRVVTYVVPMGRDVIFYGRVNVTSATPGKGDFKSTLTIEETVKAENKSQEKAKIVKTIKKDEVDENKVEKQEKKQEVKEEVKEEALQAEELETNSDKEDPLSGVEGIIEVAAIENAIDDNEEKVEKHSPFLFYSLGILTLGGVGALLYFKIIRKAR
ncbi:hypothetical protein GC105_00425 [Alkalibaculum sp. M08DMB]|uniref:Cell surface protein Shp haem-binding domain-containing protein n=1 Tax=Alkalibaculum sporogenes TaxID=2655001 RepID=A0A6A7K4F5_9FIRM|nr:heme-binding Shp domain-containing protein [Alkalibaculum sporogenes]MPW24260.1 hypothetical protein [Alkalibaculum sporogenes]